MNYDQDEDEMYRILPDPVVMVLSVVNNLGADGNDSSESIRNNLDAISRGDIRIVSAIVDIFEPLGLFGHSMNLIRSFRIRIPGMGDHRCMDSFHPVPIDMNPRQDDMNTYLGAYHLVKTIKGCSLDENGVCPGKFCLFEVVSMV